MAFPAAVKKRPHVQNVRNGNESKKLLEKRQLPVPRCTTDQMSSDTYRTRTDAKRMWDHCWNAVEHWGTKVLSSLRSRSTEISSWRRGRCQRLGQGFWRNEIRVVKQLGYMCLTLTHVAFDFQCEVQKNFIMMQLLRDVYTKEHVCGSFVEEDNRFPLFLKTYWLKRCQNVMLSGSMLY